MLLRSYQTPISISGLPLKFMPKGIEVKLLWFALSVALALLVLVLAVTASTDRSQESEKLKLIHERDNLIQELESKRLKESKVVKKKPVEKVRSSAEKVVAKATTGNRAILSQVYKTFWVDARFSTLIACESGFNIKAVGYDASHNQYNYGLFQVSQYHGYSSTYLFNPTNNIKVAKQIYDSQGFGAWPTCSRIAGFV